MELVTYFDKAKGIFHYHLRIFAADIVAMKLQPFDRALLAECEQSDKISDNLLALETTARRIEELAK